MPTYDYVCPNGHRFEVIHSVTGSGPDACVVCGAAPVRKAISAPSIHFKGSGWAKKDRTASSRPAAGASAGSSDDGGKGDVGPKTDAVPKTDGAAKSDSGKSTKESGGASDTGSNAPSSSSSGSGSGGSPAAD
jgi:putative FmdB family regulatory protein